LPNATRAIGVPGGAVAPGSVTPSAVLMGGGEVSAEPEAAGEENAAEQTGCPVDTEGEAMEASGDTQLAVATEGAQRPDPASPTPTQRGEEALTAAGAIGLLSGSAAPGSTPSAAPSGGEGGAVKPEGSGLPGLGTEPSRTLAPGGPAPM
ncbi:unnamed protein product, partial [Lampetra planeri]